MHNRPSQVRVGYVAAIIMALFWVATYFVSQPTMMRVLNALSLSIAFAIVISFSEKWVETIRKPVNRVSGPDALSLGIGCTWMAEIGQRIYSLIWRAFDQPEWMAQSFTIAFFLLIGFLGGVQHITAKGTVDGIVPKKNWMVLGWSVGVAAFAVLAFFYLGASPLPGMR